jgi:hypothetical protein
MPSSSPSPTTGGGAFGRPLPRRAEFARRLGVWPASDRDRFADLLSRYNALFGT